MTCHIFIDQSEIFAGHYFIDDDDEYNDLVGMIDTYNQFMGTIIPTPSRVMSSEWPYTRDDLKKWWEQPYMGDEIAITYPADDAQGY